MVKEESLDTISATDEEAPTTNTCADYLRKATRRDFEDFLDERADFVQGVDSSSTSSSSDYEPIVTFSVRSEINCDKTRTESTAESYDSLNSGDFAGSIWLSENRYSSYTNMIHNKQEIDLRDWESSRF